MSSSAQMKKKKRHKSRIIRLQNKKYRALILSCFTSQGISTDCSFMPITCLTLPCIFNRTFCSTGRWRTKQCVYSKLEIWQLTILQTGAKARCTGQRKKGKRCPVSSLFATMTYREKTSQGRHGKSKDAGWIQTEGKRKSFRLLTYILM